MTSFCYILLVGILVLFGRPTFGQGLGDLFYLLLIVLSILTQLIATFLVKSKLNTSQRTLWYFVIGTLFLIVAIKFTWDFTYGRGIEYRWNGSVFLG
ncbi:MAG: hypothetical protein R2852_06920 [Bacteroidia bacterium]